MSPFRKLQLWLEYIFGRVYQNWDDNRFYGHWKVRYKDRQVSVPMCAKVAVDYVEMFAGTVEPHLKGRGVHWSLLLGCLLLACTPAQGQLQQNFRVVGDVPLHKNSRVTAVDDTLRHVSCYFVSDERKSYFNTMQCVPWSN